ncbi:P-loop NTPase [Saccharolobus islandicus]|uniref:P-loop NTPase n=1 Tax=Saccharolobus islandicus TaxID=43080 RepID=UPI000493D00C|nr:P-loop NTPase [Sulfolobus islandicus]
MWWKKVEPLLELAKGKLKGKKVIAVMSSKGGVGKSVVSALLSLSLVPSATLIDLDIHSMGIAKLFSVENRSLEVSKEGIVPIKIGNVNLISLAGIVRDRYVILPGRNQSNVMKELIAYSIINSDYVVFDLPPGLGDEVLVLEELTDFKPVTVTTPSKIAIKVVKNLIEYLNERGKKSLIVVNMSYFNCHGKREYPFGYKDGDVNLPIDPNLEEYIGKIHEYNGDVKKVIEKELIPKLVF